MACISNSPVWNVSGGNSQYTIAIYELQLFASPDCSGENLAASSTGAVASASTVHSAFPAARVNDSNVDSPWISVGGTTDLLPNWVQVSLPSGRQIRSAKIIWCDYNAQGSLPMSFALQQNVSGWVNVATAATPHQSFPDSHYTSILMSL